MYVHSKKEGANSLTYLTNICGASSLCSRKDGKGQRHSGWKDDDSQCHHGA